jgi:phosphoenolpyruvate---glycerone phosphotransferase subunit DhaM
MVGIVIVSHSRDIAAGAATLARQMAGPDVRIEAAGGDVDGGLGTDGARVRAALDRAESGDGVVILGDLGSAILTVRAVLDGDDDGASDRARLADAPLVEGVVAAAVAASAGMDLEFVVRAAEEARGHSKL